jgi:hypothetical protein
VTEISGVPAYNPEMDCLSVPDQYFSLARSYLEGSRVLCEAMVNDDYTPQYSNSRVILHLCRHAIELFLKGAISKARNRQPPKTHNLVNLVGEYELALPGENFRFEVPFGVEALGNLALFPELEALIDEHHKTLDQRYRYPTDSAGKPFSGVEGFIARSYLSDLARLSKSFLKVELQLKGVGS